MALRRPATAANCNAEMRRRMGRRTRHPVGMAHSPSTIRHMIQRAVRRGLSGVIAVASVGLVLLGLLGFVASPAGAASNHYLLMTQQLGRGVPLGCADVDYAAAQGLIDPVEVRWLSAAGVKCPN